MKLLLISFLALANLCYGQKINQNLAVYTDKQYTAQVGKATKVIAALMKEKQIPGLSICVGNPRAVIWAQGFGYADLENQTPVRINSKFRVGSISKTFTAVALVKLIQTKRINLSDDIRKYVPYFPEKEFPVTLYGLASHTAGIRDYNYAKREYLSDKRYNSVEESIGIFKDDPLIFKPGLKYAYSTYGYVLLSAAIEGATHQSFLTYMQDSIFNPLQMRNTVPDYNDSLIAFRTRGYDEAKGTIVNGFHVDNSNKWAGGGFLSTPYDLVRMSQQLLNHQFLSQRSVQSLWTADTLVTGEQIKYGIGWKLDTDTHQRPYVYHGGSSVGGRALLDYSC